LYEWHGKASYVEKFTAEKVRNIRSCMLHQAAYTFSFMCDVMIIIIIIIIIIIQAYFNQNL
jgi:hypothetical protein